MVSNKNEQLNYETNRKCFVRAMLSLTLLLLAQAGRAETVREGDGNTATADAIVGAAGAPVLSQKHLRQQRKHAAQRRRRIIQNDDGNAVTSLKDNELSAEALLAVRTSWLDLLLPVVCRHGTCYLQERGCRAFPCESRRLFL